MYEVEIKVPAELEAVRERLRRVDAERVGARRQRDVYYDAPHREFAETDEALRVRHETVRPDGVETAEDDEGPDGDGEKPDGDETTRLTYKGPLLDEGSKTRSEHEAGVDDPEAMAEILDGLGFEPAATVVKRREYWAFREFTVTLDDVDGVGEFVEIEREIPETETIDATREAAVESLSRLGLDADKQVRTSYLGLLLADS
ncbi:MAG: adenylate cyclase [uncultured archaeon A07HR67]|nr:MAG: adenylate cyclase [uncultured archaeon A07HR67]